LELPSSRQTFNRIVDEVLAPTGLFRLSAKSRRSAQSAPVEDLGSLVAERPGEYVAIDTTSLDVFAIDPFTFQWVGLDLTAALDVCTRSIVAFRLTPYSTQGVDLALLLSDLISPVPMDGRWPADVPYPYCGVPENLILRAFELPAGTVLAPRPTVRPGTIVVDRGRNYQSVVFMAACEQLRINVQSARPYRGSDKGWIERLFRTMRERLLESLPGYTGPNVLAPARDPARQETPGAIKAAPANAVDGSHRRPARRRGRTVLHSLRRGPASGPSAPHTQVAGRLWRRALCNRALSSVPPGLRPRRAGPAALSGAGVAGAARARGRARGADRGVAEDQREPLLVGRRESSGMNPGRPEAVEKLDVYLAAARLAHETIWDLHDALIDLDRYDDEARSRLDRAARIAAVEIPAAVREAHRLRRRWEEQACWIRPAPRTLLGR
jgi:hypothetical protein